MAGSEENAVPNGRPGEVFVHLFKGGGVRGDLAKPTSGVPEVWPLGGAAKKGAAYGVRQPSHIGAWHHSAPPKMPAARIH